MAGADGAGADPRAAAAARLAGGGDLHHPGAGAAGPPGDLHLQTARHLQLRPPLHARGRVDHGAGEPRVRHRSGRRAPPLCPLPAALGAALQRAAPPQQPAAARGGAGAPALASYLGLLLAAMGLAWRRFRERRVAPADRGPISGSAPCSPFSRSTSPACSRTTGGTPRCSGRALFRPWRSPSASKRRSDEERPRGMCYIASKRRAQGLQPFRTCGKLHPGETMPF